MTWFQWVVIVKVLDLTVTNIIFLEIKDSVIFWLEECDLGCLPQRFAK